MGSFSPEYLAAMADLSEVLNRHSSIFGPSDEALEMEGLERSEVFLGDWMVLTSWQPIADPTTDFYRYILPEHVKKHHAVGLLFMISEELTD